MAKEKTPLRIRATQAFALVTFAACVFLVVKSNQYRAETAETQADIEELREQVASEKAEVMAELGMDCYDFGEDIKLHEGILGALRISCNGLIEVTCSQPDQTDLCDADTTRVCNAELAEAEKDLALEQRLYDAVCGDPV